MSKDVLSIKFPLSPLAELPNTKIEQEKVEYSSIEIVILAGNQVLGRSILLIICLLI